MVFMSKTHRARINSTDPYGDRESMKGEKEYMGEDVGDLGQGKGSERKRLFNEIDDNAYEENLDLVVSDDPRHWGEDLQISFKKALYDNYDDNLKKYVKIIKKTYLWVRDEELGQEMLSIVAVRAAIGMSRAIWVRAEDNSEEFLYYSTLIRDIVVARLAHLGATESKGQIFKIMSVKSLSPEDYSEKGENVNYQRIEVIQIKGVSGDDVKKAIDKSKKRLKE